MLILALVLAVAPGCAQHERCGPSSFATSARLVYIEPRTADGAWAGEFGDVVVHDLKSGLKCKITDDLYFDEGPKFSPNGELVVFASARIGSAAVRKFSGLSADRGLFIYNANDRSIRRIGMGFERLLQIKHPSYMAGYYTWFGNSKLIVAHDSSLFLYDIPTDSARLLMQATGYSSVHALSLSPSGRWLAFLFGRDPRLGIGIVDMKSDSIRTIVPRHLLSQVTGWTGDSLLIRSDSVCFIDARSGSITRLTGVPESLLVRPNWVVQLAGDDLIVHHEYDRNPPGEDSPNLIEGSDYFCYNRTSRSLTRITNDRLRKKGPDLWLPPTIK